MNEMNIVITGGACSSYGGEERPTQVFGGEP